MAAPSLLLSNLERRTEQFRRNTRLDALLGELQMLLAPAEKVGIASFDELRTPALLLVGNPRSGTTVFMQWLNLTGLFAVPSNLLARFSYAPFIGAKIQRLLCDPAFSYKDELADLQPGGGALTSELGKTKGALAPSEFFHFWRRFLPIYDPEYLDEAQWRTVDGEGLRQSIAALEAAFERPFAAKAIILQYNLRQLADILRRVLIVHVRRHPYFVMQSILQARESFYNDRNQWWSVKPREYTELKDLDVYSQIAGQVWYTEQSLARQEAEFAPAQWVNIDYADFCRHPRAEMERIVAAYRGVGCELGALSLPESGLSSSDVVKLPADDVEQLCAAYTRFSGVTLQLDD